MAKPFFDHPYLSGHHAPCGFEAAAPDLLARARIALRVLPGFHCNYYSADSALHGQALAS